jgi:hypothetical protein
MCSLRRGDKNWYLLTCYTKNKFMKEVSTVKCKVRYIQIYLPFSVQEYRTDTSCRWLVLMAVLRTVWYLINQRMLNICSRYVWDGQYYNIRISETQTQFLWHQVCCYNSFISFICFVDCASRYIHVKKTNMMHYLSSVYFVSQPLHVSGIFIAYHQ